jgi:hypothetical protein
LLKKAISTRGYEAKRMKMNLVIPIIDRKTKVGIVHHSLKKKVGIVHFKNTNLL